MQHAVPNYRVNFVKIKLLHQHNRRMKFPFVSSSFLITSDDSNIVIVFQTFATSSPKIHWSPFLIWLRIGVTPYYKNWWFIWTGLLLFWNCLKLTLVSFFSALFLRRCSVDGIYPVPDDLIYRTVKASIICVFFPSISSCLLWLGRLI